MTPAPSPAPVRLADLMDMSVVQRLAEANYTANGMPIGIIDAADGSILVGCGWQDICVKFHRADPRSLERCRESDDFIKAHLSPDCACEYRCKNGLRDIGVPILVAGEHLATLFLGQFFHAGETPDRSFFVRQARELGWDLGAYLAALDRVPVRAAAAHAEVLVRDTGVGIDPALLPALFEAFVQAEGSLARTDGGLGLGLAVVKGIVERHGGTVRAASEGPGRGTEIALRLPLAAAADAGAGTDAGEGEVRRGEGEVRRGEGEDRRGEGEVRRGEARRRRVLVVDDNADAADTLAQLVEIFGHDTEVAYDGPSALEKARANPPDVVLCDLGLPGMSGYDVARALRGDGRSALRLYAVSGYAHPDDVRRALEAGFDRHLAKPPDPDEIERLLR